MISRDALFCCSTDVMNERIANALTVEILDVYAKMKRVTLPVSRKYCLQRDLCSTRNRVHYLESECGHDLPYLCTLSTLICSLCCWQQEQCLSYTQRLPIGLAFFYFR